MKSVKRLKGGCEGAEGLICGYQVSDLLLATKLAVTSLIINSSKHRALGVLISLVSGQKVVDAGRCLAFPIQYNFAFTLHLFSGQLTLSV